MGRSPLVFGNPVYGYASLLSRDWIVPCKISACTGCCDAI